MTPDAVAYVVTAMGIAAFALWTGTAIAETRRRTRLIRAEVRDALVLNCTRCDKPARIAELDLKMRFGRSLQLRAKTECPRRDE